MTILSQDGFDSYNVRADLSTKYGSIGASVSIATTGGRYGGGSILSGGFDSSVVQTMPTPQGEIWFGVGIKNTDTTNKSIAGWFSLVGGTNAEMGLYYNPVSGVFSFQDKDANVIASGTGSLGSGVYHWLEISVVIGALGKIELWLDGVRKINFSGATNPLGGVSLAAISFSGCAGKSDALVANYDDMYMLNTLGTVNNARKGDSRIDTELATLDFGPNQGTPTTGTDHFAMVHEAHIDYDTSVLTLANTAGQKEVFGFGAMSSTPNNIWGVRVINVVKKSDGSPCNGAAYVNSATTIGVGQTVPVLTSYFNVDNIYELDPHTSAPWTSAAINAAKAGFSVVA